MKATQAQKESFKIRYRENREEVLARMNEYYKENREVRNQYNRKYQKTHRAELLVRYRLHQSNWYIANKSKVLSLQTEYRKKNKEKIKARAALYRQCPEVKEVNRLYSLRRVALKQTVADGSITEDSVAKLFLQQNGLCNICGREIDRFTPKKNEKHCHLDHIYPLIRGGGHIIQNVQWLCAPCNWSKGARIITNQTILCV